MDEDLIEDLKYTLLYILMFTMVFLFFKIAESVFTDIATSLINHKLIDS